MDKKEREVNEREREREIEKKKGSRKSVETEIKKLIRSTVVTLFCSC